MGQPRIREQKQSKVTRTRVYKTGGHSNTPWAKETCSLHPKVRHVQTHSTKDGPMFGKMYEEMSFQIYLPLQSRPSGSLPYNLHLKLLLDNHLKHIWTQSTKDGGKTSEEILLLLKLSHPPEPQQSLMTYFCPDQGHPPGWNYPKSGEPTPQHAPKVAPPKQPPVALPDFLDHGWVKA